MSLELSIIVPVYNVEKYLSECLSSLIRIEGISKEIIIVNDGSSDGSDEIIKKYIAEFPNDFIYIRQSNSGLSGARNSGLKICKGEYVVFIDSDDFVDPNKFRDLFQKGKQEELDIIVGDFEYFKNNSRFISKQMKKRSSRLSVLEENSGLEFWDRTYDHINDSIRVEVVTNIFKRKMLIKNNVFFVENLLHEDTLFMYQIIIYAKRVKYFPVHFYTYRIRENSIMRNLNYKNYLSKLFIAQELYTLKCKNKISSKCWDSYILSLYFTASYNAKIKNKNLFNKIKISKNLTFKSYLKKIIISFLHFISRETPIKL
jgi:glycosyltransferase involved in cell wall biosynthesis